MTARLHFEDLDADYITDHGSDDDWDMPVDYPDVYEFTIDGERWLTDRYWLFPASLLVMPLEVAPLPGDLANAAAAAGWVAQMRTGELRPPTGLFAPTFAGVLTGFGCEAFDCGIAATGRSQRAPHVLVRGGKRIGVLMPMVGDRVGYLPIPCPQEVLDLRRRIGASGLVDSSAAWRLAAYLTQDQP